MISVLSLNCPVCGAPFSPGADRCGYCGSILVLQTDHPRIDPRVLNRTVVDKHIAEYRDLLRADPNSVKAHYGLGVAYFNLGLTEASIDALEKASSLTPENPHIHTQLAVAWREEAKTGNARANDEMRDHIRYALRLDPRNVEALILASEAALADHDIEQAVSYSEQAWSLEPDRARDLHERALRMWYEWRRQRRDVTAADLDRLRRFSPDLAEVLNGGFRSTATPFAAPMIDMDVAPRIEKAAPVMRSVLLAFLAGIGLFVVLCGVLLTVFDTESGSSSSALLGFVLLALMSLPFVLATRAWHKARKKDQFS